MALIKFVTSSCTVCQKSSEIELDTRDITKWKDGALAQDVWPNLSDDQRELIMSGTHNSCWTEVMSAIDNDDDFFDAVFEGDNG